MCVLASDICWGRKIRRGGCRICLSGSGDPLWTHPGASLLFKMNSNSDRVILGPVMPPGSSVDAGSCVRFHCSKPHSMGQVSSRQAQACSSRSRCCLACLASWSLQCPTILPCLPSCAGAPPTHPPTHTHTHTQPSSPRDGILGCQIHSPSPNRKVL